MGNPLSFVVFQLGCAVFLTFWVVSIAANVEQEYHLCLQTNTNPDTGRVVFLTLDIVLELGAAGATIFQMWLVA